MIHFHSEPSFSFHSEVRWVGEGHLMYLTHSRSPHLNPSHLKLAAASKVSNKA